MAEVRRISAPHLASFRPFSFRFADMFPDKELVRGIQAELDQIIHAGVQNIVKLIHRTNRLEDAKDVAVTTEKTAEVVAAINEQGKTQPGQRTNVPQIRSIIGLDEELDVETKPALPMSTNRVLHSYLNALKTQAEARGHEFKENEDLIEQLIGKGLLSQRSVDKLEKQLATFNHHEKSPAKRTDTNIKKKKWK